MRQKPAVEVAREMLNAEVETSSAETLTGVHVKQEE